MSGYTYDKETGMYICKETFEERLKKVKKIECAFTRNARILALESVWEDKSFPVFRVEHIGKYGIVFMERRSSIYVGVDHTPIYASQWVPSIYLEIGTHCEINDANTIPDIWRPEYDLFETPYDEKYVSLVDDRWVDDNGNTIFEDSVDTSDIVHVRFRISRHSPNRFLGKECEWTIEKGENFSRCIIPENQSRITEFYGDRNSDILVYIKAISGRESLI